MKFRLLALFLAIFALTACRKEAPPPEPPVPVPVPDDNKVPPGSISGFLIVEDTADATQDRGLFFGSPKIVAFLKNSGLNHAIISTKSQGPDGQTPASVKKYIDEGIAKGLPHLFLIDAAGKTIKDTKINYGDQDAFVALFEPAPHKRAMGNIPPPKGRVSAFRTFGTTPNTKLIPRDQWKSVNMEAYLPPVHDQDGRGQCNASASCETVETVRNMAGMAYVYLSAGDLYSQINGGRDDGSLLEDALSTLINVGVCDAKLVPYVWDGHNHSNNAAVKASRKDHKIVEAYLCPTFEHMASALQQGFVIDEGLMWYDNFTPDRDGWLPTHGRGNAGGHALLGYGLAERNGVWGIRTRNSWGVTWGMGGNCIIPESLFGNEIGGFYAVRTVTRTPDAWPNNPALRTRITLKPDFTLAP